MIDFARWLIMSAGVEGATETSDHCLKTITVKAIPPNSSMSKPRNIWYYLKADDVGLI